MILGTFDTTLRVSININAFLIDNNFGKVGDACRSERKDHNLAVQREGTIKKNGGSDVAWRIFVVLFAVNYIYKAIRST